MSSRRILLVDSHTEARDALAVRLRTLGFEVVVASDGVEAAHAALADPPAAVVADLSMPSISGAQLARLLNAEPATADVPVILRGPEGRRNRFRAERAGAKAYVIKGRMGDLVRALGRHVREQSEEAFFTALPTEGGTDVRDRIASYLDAALFDSMIAAEVRNLAVCESFERLFDLFAQFVSQVTTYRWLAVSTATPGRIGLHTRASCRETAEREARDALGVGADPPVFCVEDDDASEDPHGDDVLVRPIRFGRVRLGTLAVAPRAGCAAADAPLLEVIARELGGALRTATLVEESQRLATVDALTGLLNRRAFMGAAHRELARAERQGTPLSLVLFDVDHFKQINDQRGHATGDRVLEAVGRMLGATMRRYDVCARWGGEEFVALLPGTDRAGAETVAERTRAAVAGLWVEDAQGTAVPVTASFGVATRLARESIEEFVDRADKAMYAAKAAGRNCVRLADPAQLAADLAHAAAE
jgi:two-component system cell cycle response regulator